MLIAAQPTMCRVCTFSLCQHCNVYTDDSADHIMISSINSLPESRRSSLKYTGRSVDRSQMMRACTPSASTLRPKCTSSMTTVSFHVIRSKLGVYICASAACATTPRRRSTPLDQSHSHPSSSSFYFLTSLCYSQHQSVHRSALDRCVAPIHQCRPADRQSCPGPCQVGTLR